MKKVPRSGNDEGRKKEEIVLRLDKDYVPTQIADYVYRTGDERGISQLFGDMIHDGQVIYCLTFFLRNMFKIIFNEQNLTIKIHNVF